MRGAARSTSKGTMMKHNLFNTLQQFRTASGVTGQYYSLPALEQAGLGKISRLPVSIRIVLESVLRNCDGKKVTEEHIRQLAGWAPTAARTDEVPFVVARVVLQDFTGVPLLCDLAAMRGVAQRMGKNPKVIEPLVPVDLVVDHSVQVDHYGTRNALDLNMKIEFSRNAERYKFMKWGMQAFDTFKVVPPGIGIVHQVNLEYLARGVHQKDGIYYPDTVVGKFVEFFGEGAASLPVPDRATIGNMAPEYGATMGFFAVDDKTIDYLVNTGRTEQEIDALEAYFRAQGLFGTPAAGAIDYSQTVELDLASVVPSLAGPKRPQDRIPLPKMKESFDTLFSKPTAENGFNQPADKLGRRYPTKLQVASAAP